MKSKDFKNVWFFGFFVIISFMTIIVADLIQKDFGNVQINPIEIEIKDKGIVNGKLYKPNSASEENPAPAVLLLHGYQNDKETCAAYGIELARRGMVVLSIDEYGHGDTKIPMKARGISKIKFPNPNKKATGPIRFKVLTNFSNLDFFYPEYSDGLEDTSMGGRAAYDVLSKMDFVDANRIGITGHSLGTWSSWSVAATFQNHKAIVLQCGELYDERYYDTEKIKMNNMLLLQAKYDEFNYFRDYKNVVPGLENTPLRYKTFAMQDSPIEWNKTYGSFEDGTARRMELLKTNHRLATHFGPAFTAAIDWFTKALEVETDIKSTNHVFMFKEILVLIAMLSALFAMLPLMSFLLSTKFFAECVSTEPKRETSLLKGKKWWKTAGISILISGITFPFITQLGHGLFPVPESIFRMTIGNGVTLWLTLLMIISAIMLNHWYKKGEGKKLGVNLNDLGLAKKGTRIFLKSILLAFILCAIVYIMVTICNKLFMLDFRFIWPFFRPFTTGARLGQFFVYLPLYFAFFFVAGGIKLFGQLRLEEASTPMKTQLKWWGMACIVMLGGMFMSVLIEYIPFFAGIGPGADLLFTSLFGGPFMSYLILAIPQFALVFYLATYAFRKTGYVYLGSTMMAIISSWMLCSGSAIL